MTNYIWETILKPQDYSKDYNSIGNVWIFIVWENNRRIKKQPRLCCVFAEAIIATENNDSVVWLSQVQKLIEGASSKTTLWIRVDVATEKPDFSDNQSKTNMNIQRTNYSL